MKLHNGGASPARPVVAPCFPSGSVHVRGLEGLEGGYHEKTRRLRSFAKPPPNPRHFCFVDDKAGLVVSGSSEPAEQHPGNLNNWEDFEAPRKHIDRPGGRRARGSLPVEIVGASCGLWPGPSTAVEDPGGLDDQQRRASFFRAPESRQSCLLSVCPVRQEIFFRAGKSFLTIIW